MVHVVAAVRCMCFQPMGGGRSAFGWQLGRGWPWESCSQPVWPMAGPRRAPSAACPFLAAIVRSEGSAYGYRRCYRPRCSSLHSFVIFLSLHRNSLALDRSLQVMASSQRLAEANGSAISICAWAEAGLDNEQRRAFEVLQVPLFFC